MNEIIGNHLIKKDRENDYACSRFFFINYEAVLWYDKQGAIRMNPEEGV